MQKFIVFFMILALVSCKNQSSKDKEPKVSETTFSSISYANGLEISHHQDYSIVTLTEPWPGSNTSFRYLLKKNETSVDKEDTFDAVVQVPLTSIVVTSTTHIPSLEMLQVEKSLKGFPNLDYVSSEKTRKLIDNGTIVELGKNESLNTEVLIDLNPDALITFAVEGQNTTVATLQKTGIPVLYNADWTETHPLGKAEWIKFFGVLFGKEKEADRIFSTIEKNYQEAKSLAETTYEKPTVLSGAMFRDVWYLPQGGSWGAQFIEDAHGAYLWKDTEGTGSLSLNLESVLEKGKNADFWIGPSQFYSYQQMEEAHTVYTQFKAFQEKKIYSFTTKKGPKGGVVYYELAPNRPDLVLKDLIKILHPEVLPDYPLYFFEPLQ